MGHDMGFLLTIAGHDPVNGAGITADLATWRAMGLHGASVVTALTVQNSRGLERVQPVDATIVRDALQAVLRDGEPTAIKAGMLGSADVAREVAAFLAERRCPVVVDPVLAGSNGRSAHGDAETDFLAAIREVMRCADVITPNRPEAARLLGASVTDALAAAHALRGLCRGAVVLKGGHDDGARCVDWVCDAERSAALAAPRLPASSHGTGCVFSAALAGMLAQGWNVFEAAAEARLRVQAGIAEAWSIGPGRANTNPHATPSSGHLPNWQWLSRSAELAPVAAPFVALSGPLGFYPVVATADWVERLLTWGVRTVQLRIKAGAMPEAEVRAQLAAAVHAAREVSGAQLFINDHWREALALGAYGVHLGQEDLDTADLAALRAAGVRLGVSSHTPLEMARAHAVQPSYVALGPVYETTLKAMRYDALGLANLRAWTRRYQPRYPVVAIGGISLARAPAVWACGVDSIAVVSAVTQAAQPREAVRAFVELTGAPYGLRPVPPSGSIRPWGGPACS
jgi:hydroxymethylpyrimidine kinase / phosphomethylpyrimidine kinase / thiamine-phosphate diphosphorylase